MTNKHVVTIFAVIVALGMAAIPAADGAPAGTGGKILWPLFGAINQLLAGLAFLVIVFWMRRRGMPTWFIIIPAVLMLIFPAWAMFHQIFVQGVGMDGSWIEKERWLLVSMGVATLLLEMWMIAEAFMSWRKLSDAEELEVGELSLGS